MKTTTAAAKKKTAAKRTRTIRPTREYERGFTPADGIGSELKIRRIPTPMWRQVKAKARREGVSLRGLVLRHLQAFIEGAV